MMKNATNFLSNLQFYACNDSYVGCEPINGYNCGDCGFEPKAFSYAGDCGPSGPCCYAGDCNIPSID